MKLVLADPADRPLATYDLQGTNWVQVVNHFENLEDLRLAATVDGTVAGVYVQSGNDRIDGDVPGLAHRAINRTDEVTFHAGSLKLTFHEQRSNRIDVSDLRRRLEDAAWLANSNHADRDELAVTLADLVKHVRYLLELVGLS